MKNAVEQAAEIGRALGNPTRLQIVEILIQRPWSVSLLAEALEMNIQTVSNHLQILKSAGVVSSNREGTRVVYAISSQEAVAAYAHFMELVGYAGYLLHNASDSELVGAVEINTVDEDVVYIDVRPADEYDHGHLPGALMISLDEIEDRLHEIPPDRNIIVYCRGPLCEMSHQAVGILTERGYSARVLRGGYTTWLAERLPT